MTQTELQKIKDRLGRIKKWGHVELDGDIEPSIILKDEINGDYYREATIDDFRFISNAPTDIATLIDEVEESKQAVRLAYDTLSHKFKKPMSQSWDKYVENGFKFMELEIVNRIMTEKPCKQSTKS